MSTPPQKPCPKYFAAPKLTRRMTAAVETLTRLPKGEREIILGLIELVGMKMPKETVFGDAKPANVP